ncbi:MAG TPA: S-layer homology domain-containing protein [Clostridia bacterium]|nr:S-layer homology domain-containing protein [Clostridia bacterium]
MKTIRRNTKVCLMLLLTIVILLSPILSVEASVKGVSENLIIDMSGASFDYGYFNLPVEKSASFIFRMGYYPGYIDEETDTFTALGVRVFDPRNWAYDKMLKIPLKVNLIKLNNVFVFTYRDEYEFNRFYIPAYLNDKKISIEVVFNEGNKGEIVGINEKGGNGSAISIKKGDIIKPIYRSISEQNKIEEVEEFILEANNIVVEDSIVATIAEFPADKYAFKIFAQSASSDGHGTSDAVAVAQITANKKFRSEPSSWAIAEINNAVERGFATGRVLKDYQKPITREEFCELIIILYDRLADQPATPADSNPFKDTDNAEVLKAYNLGIVTGIGNGEFGPNKPLNREQMSTMLFNMIKLVRPDIEVASEELTFNDRNTISKWAYQPIKYMYMNKLILGANNLFNPQKEASREQAIILILRIFEKYKTGL